MTNYVKSTNFTSKDSLPTGNVLKIIKGSEFDTEFNNIVTAVDSKADLNSPSFTGIPTAATAAAGTADTQIATTSFVSIAAANAVASKANIASPAFTGVPTAPTAAAGTATTQLSTTAFTTTALQALYPVGSVYMNASSNTNPASFFGFGAWSLFGGGRVPMGNGGGVFGLGATGGSNDSAVISHSHTASSNSVNLDHSHSVYAITSGSDSPQGTLNYPVYNGASGEGGGSGTPAYPTLSGMSANAAHSHSITVDAAGSSGSYANLQPFIVVNMWVRTS